jgi:hypothetical protein
MSTEKVIGNKIEMENNPFASSKWYSGTYEGCTFTLCDDYSEYGQQLRVEWPEEVPFESEPEGLEIEEEIKNYYDEHRPYTT